MSLNQRNKYKTRLLTKAHIHQIPEKLLHIGLGVNGREENAKRDPVQPRVQIQSNFHNEYPDIYVI